MRFKTWWAYDWPRHIIHTVLWHHYGWRQIDEGIYITDNYGELVRT